MMGQELFENPHRQYELYRVTAHEKLSQTLGDPEEFPAERPTAEQEAAMEEVLAAEPEAALTYDAATELWISGAEDDINRLFSDRDEFVDARENGDDPGA